MWLSGHNFIPPRRFLGLLIIFWAIFAAPSSLFAQMAPGTTSSEPTATAVEIPEDLTQEQVRDLIAHLSDDQVRELVIAQLDKLAAEQDQAGEPSTYVSHLHDGFDVARVTLARTFNSNNEIYTLPKSIWQQMTGHGQISGWYILLQLIGLLVVGWIARLLTRHLLAKASTKSEGALPLEKRFDLACYGIFTGMLELGAFAVGAYLFIKITGQQTPMAQIFWYQVIWCLVLIKLVMLGVKQVVSVDSPDTGLAPVSSTVAKQALAWTLILTTFLVLPRPLVNLVVDFGASVETELLLSIIFGGGFILLLIALMIHLRHYGTELIAAKDGKSGGIRQAFARNWWLLAIVYLLIIWFMAIGKRAATGESSLVPGLTSIILFLLIPYFDRALQWLITRYFEDKDEEEEIPPADTAGDEGIPSAGGAADVATAESIPAEAAVVEPTAGADTVASTSNTASAYAAAAITAPTASTDTVTTTPDTAPADAAADIVASPSVEDIVATAQSNAPVYIATALRYARVLMVVLILAIFMRLWDIDIRAISGQLLGPRFADALFDIGITVLMTWALWGVIRISIERKLDTGETLDEEQEEAEAGGLGH